MNTYTNKKTLQEGVTDLLLLLQEEEEVVYAAVKGVIIEGVVYKLALTRICKETDIGRMAQEENIQE